MEQKQAASISTRVVCSCCQFQNLMHSWLSTSYVGCDISTIYYLVVSTPLKNISQNGNLTQIGVKIKHIWNHQPNNLWWGEELYCDQYLPTLCHVWTPRPCSQGPGCWKAYEKIKGIPRGEKDGESRWWTKTLTSRETMSKQIHYKPIIQSKKIYQYIP